MNAPFLGRLSLFACCAIGMMAGTSSAALDVVDQSNELSDFNRSEEFYMPLGQSFTPLLRLIDFVELELRDNSTSPDSHTVKVNIRDALITGPILATSETLFLPDCFNHSTGPGCGIGGGTAIVVRLDFIAPVPIVPGTVHVLEVVTTGDIGVSYQNSGNPYAGGTAIFEGIADPNSDLWFREGVTVPEPSAVTLILAGLMILTTRRR